jgi:ornithine carbamoyltransferase
MIGEPQGEALSLQLASLGRPGGRWLDRLDPADQQMVDRKRTGGPGETEALTQCLEDTRVLGWPQVEVTAEEQRRIPRPPGRRLGRAQNVGGGEVGAVVGRVQIGDADPRCRADESHRSPLRPALVDRQLPPLPAALFSSEWRRLTDQSEVGTALGGCDQVGIEAGGEGAQGAEGVARGEHAVRLRFARLSQGGGEARRALLQQGDVPLGGRKHRGELRAELSVDLQVRRVALGDAQQARAPGEQRRVRREVAAVEEIPADGGEFHRRSIRCLTKRDFLTGEEIGAFELGKLLDRAAELKAGRGDRLGAATLAGRSIALVFEKPSTRTRISFEVGVAELGATPVVLRGDELQLSRGESVGDTARVLSRYVDAIVIRSGSHEAVAELAAAAEAPVVNALTPLHHPCQALADLLTLRERFGDLSGLRLAYVGDGNNVARSLTIAGELAGVEVVVAAPSGYQLEEGHEAKLTADPRDAAAGADAIYTDVWVSMGDEAEADRRRADLSPFRLDADLLAAARDSAIVLHCLPAHPGEEVTAEVLYGERSAVWDQAENRLHAQKALLEMLLAD